MTSLLRLTIPVFLTLGAAAAQDLTSLTAEPAVLRLAPGESAGFLVTAVAADGLADDVTATASAVLSAPDKLRIDTAGQVKALQQGQAAITLSHGGRTAEIKVEITAPPTAPVSFVRDVLPVLGKAGCNAAACHARADGQNGFKLSVFSFDPRSDYRQIVHGARGRRVFPSAPGESLLLLKATGTVPHEGGERIAPDSDAWRTLAAWIGSGMTWQGPDEPAIARVEVLPKERRYRKNAAQQSGPPAKPVA